MQTITPRRGLDFGLDRPISRHWLDGDVFKTRFFDATSTLFPEGERFFIASVARYREQIDDPELRARVRAFMIQEAQHGQQHELFNRHLVAQGIDVARLEAQSKRAFAFLLRRVPKRVTLAQTAAAEHVTALLATALFEQPELLRGADPRMRALYLWHGVEEIEHRSVAFDVMKDVAQTPYFLRVIVMLNVVLGFHLRVFYAMSTMFRADRLSVASQLATWARGLAWLLGASGPYAPLWSRFLAYFRFDFHPSHTEAPPLQRKWAEALDRNRAPLEVPC